MRNDFYLVLAVKNDKPIVVAVCEESEQAVEAVRYGDPELTGWRVYQMALRASVGIEECTQSED